MHVEMIEPRRRDPARGPVNDAAAPDPGFTAAQLRRLAAVFVAAKERAGFHLGTLDTVLLETFGLSANGAPH